MITVLGAGWLTTFLCAVMLNHYYRKQLKLYTNRIDMYEIVYKEAVQEMNKHHLELRKRKELITKVLEGWDD